MTKCRVPEQLYSIRQVADLCGVSAVTIWRDLASGKIKGRVKLGHRTTRIRASVVADYQASRDIES